MLADLQRQQTELERVAKRQEEIAARFDKDAQMRAAEAIQDPIERMRAIQEVSRTESMLLTEREINLLMQRVVGIQQAVIHLADRLERVEQALSR
jgi:hypothetical protein